MKNILDIKIEDITIHDIENCVISTREELIHLVDCALFHLRKIDAIMSNAIKNMENNCNNNYLL